MIIVVFMRSFQLSVEIKVIRDCDSFTSPSSAIGPENSPQMQYYNLMREICGNYQMSRADYILQDDYRPVLKLPQPVKTQWKELKKKTKEIMVLTSNITTTFRSQDNQRNSLVMCRLGTQRAQIHSLCCEPPVGRSILITSNVIIRICMVPYDNRPLSTQSFHPTSQVITVVQDFKRRKIININGKKICVTV